MSKYLYNLALAAIETNKPLLFAEVIMYKYNDFYVMTDRTNAYKKSDIDNLSLVFL